MMTKISIIVPVYKAEKYLSICIDSILAQTYNNFELLLINDGSTDNSGAICDEYARKDKRIKAFHKRNGGVSSARNVGLDNSTGDWVCFVDSDDYLSLRAIELMVSKIGKFKGEIICCNNYYTDNNGVISSVKFVENENETTAEQNIRQILLYKIPTTNWGKLYKRSLVGDCRFDSAVEIGEDLLFHLHVVFQNLEMSVLYCNESIYYYRTWEGSVMTTKYQQNDFTVLNNKVKSLIEGKDNGFAFMNEFSAFVFAHLYLKIRYAKNFLSREDYLDYLPIIKGAYKLRKEMTFKYRVWVVSYRANRIVGNFLMKLWVSFYDIKRNIKFGKQ